MRWSYGDTNPVQAPVRADTVIERGDLLFQDSDGDHTAKPMSVYFEADDDPDLSYADDFLGVAMQHSRAGNTDDIRVATSGTFTFELEFRTLSTYLGEEVAPALDDDGHPVNQVIAVLDHSHATPVSIGYIAKYVSHPLDVTSALVDIRSRVMHR